MKKFKLAFAAVAIVAALSAFTTKYFTDFHYVLSVGQFERVPDYSPDGCDIQIGSQCTYIFSTSSTNPPQTVTSQDPEYNSILNNPEPNGADKVYVID